MKSAEDHLKDDLFVIIDGGDFAYEAALKAIIEAQRDALEAAAKVLGDDRKHSDAINYRPNTYKLADFIRDMKPKETEA